MENTNLTNSNHVTDKIHINLNMFGSLMLNRVGRQIDGTNIITVDKSGSRKRKMQLTKKVTKPCSLSYDISNTPVLGFDTRTGDGVLSLGRPRK